MFFMLKLHLHPPHKTDSRGYEMGRTPCCEKDGLKKGPWTTEEDQMLIDHIQKHGPGHWRALPKISGLQRCGKSCRLRWTNYLRPDIKRGKFSAEEEETIIRLHGDMGNKWSAIAAKLPGRTDNEIKNYWNTHIRKKLLRMGIDPVTHGPRLDLLDLTSILTSLQNPSLLNIPSFLNLQTLLNPELLRPAPSQTGLSQSSLDNSFITSLLAQNQSSPSVHFPYQIGSQVKNFPFQPKTSMGTNFVENQSIQCNVKTEQHGLKEPNTNWYDRNDQGSLYQSIENSPFVSNNSNQSGISYNSSFSSQGNPIDESLMYLNSSPSIEDDLEIDSFFSKIFEKLDNPGPMNVSTS